MTAASTPSGNSTSIFWRLCSLAPFTEMNARIAWTISRIELALIGQDLAHARHPEFGPDTPTRVEFERAVRVMVTLRLP